MSPPGIDSSSLRLPGAFSGSTGVAPWVCCGTVNLILFASDAGDGDAVRFGDDISKDEA